MTAPHAAVFIDHHIAHVLFLHEDDAGFERTVLEEHAHHARRDGHRPAPPAAFFERVAGALADARHIVVLGPASAKDELVVHLGEKHPALRERVMGVIPTDHPTDAQVAQKARLFFEARDRMRRLPRLG